MSRFFLKDGALWDSHDLCEPVMADTPKERRQSWPILREARGDVLIFGLGIGLIIDPIERKADVRSVMIVEKHREVIDLVTPTVAFGPKVRIVEGDVFTYEPDQMFDCIWVDIWTTQAEDAAYKAAGIDTRHAAALDRLRPHLRDGGFIGQWENDDAL